MLPGVWRWLRRYWDTKERFVIGLLSGTSADGVDAALVRLTGRGPKRVELLASSTIPYPSPIRRAIFHLFHDGDVETLCRLNFQLGELFAESAFMVAQKAGVTMAKVHLIGSHGQTVRHLPGRRRKSVKRSFNLGSTLQIGEAAVVAVRTGVPVVSNFRVKDMVVGGEGAPLAPLLDWLLLRHPQKGRVALNIGGIANLTVLPPKASPDQVIAFDTGPGNMLIDGAIRHFTGGKRLFDRGGRWARQGQVNKELLRWLMRHPFLRQSPPKSTGREMFGEAFLDRTLKKAHQLRLSPFDVIATLTAFTVESIAAALERFVLPLFPVREVFVSGGGADNPTMMAWLQRRLNPLSVRRSEEEGIPAEAKEAILFAVLAHRTVMGLPGNIPKATGAKAPVILGTLTLP